MTNDGTGAGTMKVLIAWLMFFAIIWVVNRDKVELVAGKVHAAITQAVEGQK